ncbi:MAG: outer membrane protein multidrug efflux system, partial [Verrucomicrobiota bacterium]
PCRPGALTRRPRCEISGLWGFAPLLLACLLLSGCAVGPNYHRPDAHVPQQFRLSSDPASTNSLADIPWWQIFNDPTLTNLIHIALTNNYDVRIAATRVEQSRALAVQTRSQYFPQAGYEASAYRGKNSTAGSATYGTNHSTANSFLGALDASWEIDLWGRIRRLNESARAQFLASKEARRGVILSLITDVAQDYFRLLELDAELEIAERTTNAFSMSLKIFSQRRQGGIASKLETDRAEGALAAVAATIPDLRQRIRLLENDLNLLLGLGSGAVARTARLDDQSLPPAVPAGLPSALLERRPDIRQSEQLLRSANAQIGVSVAEFLPKIGLTALFGGASPELSAITTPASEVWSLGVAATGPLFTAGYHYGKYRQSVAAWEEAKLQYQQTALAAFHEVAGILFTRQRYEEARVERNRSVAAYEDAVKIATERYRAGHANYFEVLDVQQQLLPQENALAQTELNQFLIIVRLYQALGGGWNLPDPTELPKRTVSRRSSQ